MSEILSSEERNFMRAMGRITAAVPRSLNADLSRKWGLQLSEYFALGLICETPEGRMGLSTIAENLCLSLSGVSRMVSKLENAGLVARERSAEDGRAFDAVVTDAGRRLQKDAFPDYSESSRRNVLQFFEGYDLRDLATRLWSVASEAGIPSVRSE